MCTAVFCLTEKDKVKKKIASCGSYTVEAALVILPFIVAFLSVVLLVSAVRTETRIRYALGQTAKEIAGYCYPVGRVCETAGFGKKADTEKADELLGSVSAFSAMFGKGGKEKDGAEISVSDVKERIGDVRDDFKSVTAASVKLERSLSALSDDPKAAISALSAVLLETAAGDAVGRVSAIVLCKLIMPGYIVPGGDKAAVSAELERMGVAEGLSGLNFGLSSIMTDGRSINLVVFYEIELFGGMIPARIRVRQSASTSAWLPEHRSPGEKDDGSIWRLDNFTRGQYFVAEIKKENRADAVKGGKGFDLYDGATSTFTSVISLNVFGSGYSYFTPPEDGEAAAASNYRLKHAAFGKGVREGINKLKKSIDAMKPGDVLEREFKSRYGNMFTPDLKNYHLTLILVLPEEAEEMDGEIEGLLADLEEKSGVKIRREYRYKALINSEAEENDKGEKE
ncbi:MAG: hypothetical protein MJ137_01915 [Clostridia bacterium]|nr:hypothetical protein [Clostridia bacterium]